MTHNSIRDLFEIPEGVTYLNCAAMAPQLRSVTEAGFHAVRRKASPWKLTDPEWFSGGEELRNLCAQLMRADADGIALIPAASYGIAIAAANLPVQPGQSIIVLDQEYSSNFYAWQELAKRRSAEIKTVKRIGNETWTDALLSSIDLNTGIVAVPHCHWTDGAALDLIRVSESARSFGAAIAIDASQSLGAYPLDLKSIQPDFVVSVGYKWLLGPYGFGYLYAAPKWRQRGTPIEYSALSRVDTDDSSHITYPDDYRPGARRFDMGGFPQFVLAPMAIAALKQVLAWSVENIHHSLTLLTDYVAECAAKKGYIILAKSERLGHIIGIRFPDGIPNGLQEKLHSEKIYLSVRAGALRVAPHLYNSREDIDRMFESLP